MKRKNLDPDTESAIRRFLALISDRYDVRQAIVYGSRARGTHQSDSDVDVAIILNGKRQDLLNTKLDMAKSAFDVLLETEFFISPLPIWLNEWENPSNYRNPVLLHNIDMEGIRL